MPTRLCAALLVALIAAASTSCGGPLFGKQYEYEEDMTIALDGSATLFVNASLASLVTLRGMDVPVDPNARIDRDHIRDLFSSPATSVTRVSRPWTRRGRRFVQVRIRIADVRRLREAPAFAWSKYGFTQENGRHVFTQVVGPAAMKPGSLKNYGWDGKEMVAFRLHLPSKILFHNARDVETNETASVARGNILAWEQPLADRLDGRPVEVRVEMESQSILYRTLWLFAGAFLAAIMLLGLLIWWFVWRGKDEPSVATP
jgi:hypothetical protein